MKCLFILSYKLKVYESIQGAGDGFLFMLDSL